MNTHGNGPPVEQPEHFEFTPENMERVQVHLAKYPQGRQWSAVLPLLDLAQRQSGGWLPVAAMNHVADLLQMPHIRVYEVATFYTMFNLRPVGRWFLQVCTTTPCWLRGSEEVVAACERKLGIGIGETTPDGLFTLVEVECLGACVNAPILQVNDDYYEDLDGPKTEALLAALRDGKPPPFGSLSGRRGSAPTGGKTALTELPEPPPLQAALTEPPEQSGEKSDEDAYKEKDWLASADMNFRPINTYTGPDGCFYIVDMYHGIIQESEWTTPDSYLGKMIAQKGLHKNKGMGRIYRVVHDDFRRDENHPNMLDEPAAKLVSYLNHVNGWWRDNAQQLLIVRNDKSVVPDLKKIATGEPSASINKPGQLARIHALWTLEGLNAMDKPTLIRAFSDPDPQVRKAAVWISEMYIRKNDLEVIDKLASLKNDKSADVLVQLSLSLRVYKTGKAAAIVKDLLAANQNNQMIQFSYATFSEAQKTREEEAKRTLNLSPADRELVKNGQVIFKQLCANCHGPDGKGITIGGNEMPAPPLAGSPRLRGDKVLNIQLLLYGLRGPVDGKTYKDIMPSMGGNDDKWIASVLSYVRNSSELGNKASIVTPEEVKTVRANSPKEIPGGITLQLLEIFKLGRAERTNWDEKR